MVITVKKSTSKITLSDIAREANVGVATVDRVLNKRAAVKESTAYRVLEAARRLGFTLEQPHYRLAAGKAPVTVRMGFILLQETHSFYLPLARALTREAAPWLPAGQAPVILHFAIDAVEAMAQAIHRLSDEVEVLGLVALDHPLIRHAVAGPPPAAFAYSPYFQICRFPSAAAISASITKKPGAPPPGLSTAYAVAKAK
jgi:LacI family transcriptional regulator